MLSDLLISHNRTEPQSAAIFAVQFSKATCEIYVLLSHGSGRVRPDRKAGVTGRGRQKKAKITVIHFLTPP